MIVGYTGTPGSGKSYAVVETVIAKAAREGRTVCSNVHGLNLAAIGGDVRIFEGRDTLTPEFWPNREGTGWCPNGSVIVVDEVGIIWSHERLAPAIVNAFREHRHYTGPGGENVEIHLVTQNHTDYPRAIKGLIETLYDFKRLSALGLSKSYRCNVYGGGAPLAKSLISQVTGKYKKEVFDLYSSTANNASVVTTSSRVTAGLKKKLILLGLAFALLIVGLFTVVTFFRPHKVSGPSASAPAASSSSPAGSSAVIPATVPRADLGKCFGIVVINGVRNVVCENGFESPSSVPAVVASAGI
jgi:zona occludens toxin